MIAPRKLHQDVHELRVLWSDGHEAVYPYAYLRDQCPCAACREGIKAQASSGGCGSGCGCSKGEAGPAGERAQLAEIQLVGRYALQFYWQDGHAAGLYAFDLLRDLCPCPPCEARPPVLR